jgi:hypothetical protein
MFWMPLHLTKGYMATTKGKAMTVWLKITVFNKLLNTSL